MLYEKRKWMGESNGRETGLEWDWKWVELKQNTGKFKKKLMNANLLKLFEQKLWLIVKRDEKDAKLRDFLSFWFNKTFITWIGKKLVDPIRFRWRFKFFPIMEIFSHKWLQIWSFLSNSNFISIGRLTEISYSWVSAIYWANKILLMKTSEYWKYSNLNVALI